MLTEKIKGLTEKGYDVGFHGENKGSITAYLGYKINKERKCYELDIRYDEYNPATISLALSRLERKMEE